MPRGKNLYLLFKVVLIVLVACINYYPLNAQKAKYEPRQKERLEALSKKFFEFERNAKITAEIFAMKEGLPVRKVFDDGTVIEIQYIDPKGMPVYHQTDNLGAAITVGTDKLHPGGGSGTGLTGSGFFAGVWDSGDVDSAHIEFQNRLFLKETEEDSRGTSEHATHVAGTIAAAGKIPGARGMAFEADIHSYDWNGFLSELAWAAGQGYLLSNHSYGIRLGWTRSGGQWQWNGDPDANEDYRFGFYNESRSRALDQIAYEAPYFLTVWSTGNFRNGHGDGSKEPNGPWDCIGPEKVAKNVLAVGAVEKIPDGYSSPEDVVMTTFSSWGPADDGRVKPDLVAAGRNLYSTIPGGGYDTKSGTSMSAPNATGSLLLLQQLHHELYGVPMRSATLKGLAIHTVNQTGENEGPDYSHGWGLLNVEKAAEVLMQSDGVNNIIKEKTLKRGEVYEFDIIVTGIENITATLSWTDPPGEPPAPQIDPDDLMLVNDLDIRISSENGRNYRPWKLNPSDPSAKATRGDNFRDNIEKILAENPAPGRYTVKVSHKGTLKSSSQDFSLILSTSAFASTYDKYLYWTGGGGDWNNPENWSADSGGEPAGMVPDNETTVIFDHNSFEERGQTVLISESAESHNFVWNDEYMHNINFSEETAIEVYGSFYLMSDSLVFTEGSVIKFYGEGNKIRTGKLSEGNTVFAFMDNDGDWELLSDLTTGMLKIEGGKFNSGGNKIAVKDIVVVTDEDLTEVDIDFSSSVIEGLRSFSVERGILNLSAEGSIFEFTPGENEEALLDAAYADFDQLIIRNGNLSVKGDNTFRKIICHESLSLHGNNSIDQLTLKESSGLFMAGGTLQNINDTIAIDSHGPDVITIQSLSEVPATISVNRNLKYCIDNLYVYNVRAEGEALMVAEPGSILEGDVSGWYSDVCENVLFADFKAEYACTGGITFFTDISSGYPDSWLWNFGDEGNGLSEEKNPQYIYEEEGYYNVNLEVGNQSETHEQSREIYVMDNTLEETEIFVKDKRYTSSRIAPQYQWFLDDEPIAGAISRSFINEERLTGSFTVMIMDDKCNRLSEEVLVSIEDVIPPEDIIKVYPNPFTDNISVEILSLENGDVSVEILSMEGKSVFRQNYLKSSPVMEVTIPAFAYFPGIYIIRIFFNDNQHVTSILKK